MSVDERSPRVAVAYYSATGNVHAIAEALAKGAAAPTPVRAS